MAEMFPQFEKDGGLIAKDLDAKVEALFASAVT
jgi:hypothetical protein